MWLNLLFIHLDRVPFLISIPQVPLKWKHAMFRAKEKEVKRNKIYLILTFYNKKWKKICTPYGKWIFYKIDVFFYRNIEVLLGDILFTIVLVHCLWCHPLTIPFFGLYFISICNYISILNKFYDVYAVCYVLNDGEGGRFHL